MAINKRQEKTNAGMDVKKREPFCPLMEKLQIGAATMQNSIEVPQKKKKMKVELPYQKFHFRECIQR